jgi:hypothetical protein
MSANWNKVEWSAMRAGWRLDNNARWVHPRRPGQVFYSADEIDELFVAVLPDGNRCDWDDRLRTVGAHRVLKVNGS